MTDADKLGLLSFAHCHLVLKKDWRQDTNVEVDPLRVEGIETNAAGTGKEGGEKGRGLGRGWGGKCREHGFLARED